MVWNHPVTSTQRANVCVCNLLRQEGRTGTCGRPFETIFFKFFRLDLVWRTNFRALA